MTEKSTYPVAGRYTIPPRKNWLESLRNRLKDIPRDRNDVAVVLEVDGFHELVPSGTNVEKADNIRSASALVFVDIRRKIFNSKFKVNCKGNLEQREVTVRYQVQINDPVAILDEGIEDFVDTIGTWSRATLRDLSVRYGPGEPEPFQDHAIQLIQRELVASPPVPNYAIDLRLADIEVADPEGWAKHGRNQVAKSRATETRLHSDREDERVEHARRRIRHAANLNDLVDEEEVFSAGRRLAHAKEADRQQLMAGRAAQYEDAYKRGPEAILALIAADNPAALADMVAQKVRDREFLGRMILEAADSGVIQSTELERSLVGAAHELLRSASGGALTVGGAQIDAGDVASVRGETGLVDDDGDVFVSEDDSAGDQDAVPPIDLTTDSESQDLDEEELLTSLFGEPSDNGAGGDPSVDV